MPSNETTNQRWDYQTTSYNTAGSHWTQGLNCQCYSRARALGLMTAVLYLSLIFLVTSNVRVFIFSWVRCTIAFGCELLARSFSKPSKSPGCLAKSLLYVLSQLSQLVTLLSVSTYVWEVPLMWPGLFQILVMSHLSFPSSPPSSTADICLTYQLLPSSVVLRINQHACLVN